MKIPSALIIAMLLMALLMALPTIPSADSFGAAHAHEALGVDAPTENPCPEGDFLDLGAELCRPLTNQLGFDETEFLAQFSDNAFDLNSCTQDALIDLLRRAKPTGGTISIPACTIPITRSITIPGGVIFQGAGMDQTIFEAQPGFSGNVLRSKEDANIIIRDLTIDGANTDSTGIVVWYVRNVLIERVRAHHNGRSGITFRYAKKVTVRYSESHDHVEFHGIGSKDCFPKEESVPDAVECRDHGENPVPDTLWSYDYAVYSNRLYNNGDYGIDIHASSGEVAGNLAENNVHGSKFPDGSRLWIHHNVIRENEKLGLRLYNTLDANTRRAGNAIIYQNRFANNGSYPLHLYEPARQVILIDNVYTANGQNRLRVKDATVFKCPNTTEATIEVDGTPLQLATDETCNLGTASALFPLSSVYLPVTTNQQ